MMLFMFDSEEKQEKHAEHAEHVEHAEQNVLRDAPQSAGDAPNNADDAPRRAADAPRSAAARGLSRLRAGLRKSDTQELDYREVAEKQAKLAAERKRAEQAAAEEHTKVTAAEPAQKPVAEPTQKVAAEPTQKPAVAKPAQDIAPAPETSKVQEPPEETARERERKILQREIASLQQALKKYGFGFPEMRDAAPKSDKLREQCREVTCVILHEGMLEGLRRDKRLPLKEICDDLDIPALKIEEHRKYIIAVCEILDGDYPYLSEFLGETRERLHETSRLYHRG